MTDITYEWVLLQDDEFVAGGECSTIEEAETESNRYFLQYKEDGPVELTIYKKEVVSERCA